ncbi:MAG: hypothetical protein LBI28_11695, partial [Treponema sp.]|nr:hypothetical protein [Treponema sp.]
METYIEQGISRKDCEIKIMEKYKRPFRIFSSKEIRFGGFLGLFPRTGIQVEFYFTPAYKTPVTQGFQNVPPVSWNLSDNIEIRQAQPSNDLEEVKRKVLAAAGKDYDR